MASYTRTAVQVSLSHVASSLYTTETDIVTVTAGHQYLLKQLEIRGVQNDAGSGSHTGGMSFKMQIPGGSAEFFRATPRVASLDATGATRFDYHFAYPVDDIITALPATVLTGKTALDPGEGQVNILNNRWFGPTEVLRFSPLDSAGAGYGNSTGLNSLEFNITAHFLDFTV